MIRNVESLRVGGISNMKIAAMDYRAQSVSQAAQVNVSFVEENNNLFSPVLSYTSPTSIKVGSINLRMFPVSWERTRSASSENILNVTYVDGSFILDQFFVGLKSKHHEYRGNQQTIIKRGAARGTLDYNANPQFPVGNIHSNLILVGEYVDPCKDINKSTLRDPCDPCPDPANSNELEERYTDCVKRRSMEILNVEYSFSDLLNEIKNKGINISVNASFNTAYKSNYVGTLRSVLQSWCSDFGFSFVFDGSGGKGRVFIYDLSAGVNINLKGLRSYCSTVNFSERKSIESTFAKGIIAHYAIEGQERQFDCNSSYGGAIGCRALNLRDLVGKAPWRTGQPLYTSSQVNISSFDAMEMCCLLSSYSPRLREAAVWFDLYGLRSYTDAKRMVSNEAQVSRISGISIRAGGYKNDTDDFERSRFTMPLLQMTMKAVASEKLASGTQDIFNSILSNLDDGIQIEISRMRKKGYSAYFFIASQNDDMLQSLTDWESDIGQNFLGKYFIRKYDSTVNVPPSFVAAGSDSVQFYKQGVDKMEFSYNFPYGDASSYIDELSDSRGVAEDSFVLVTRGSSTIPPRGEGDEMAQTIQTATDILPTRLGYVNQLLGENWQGLENKASNLKTWTTKLGVGDYLYIAYEVPSGLNTSGYNYRKHPDEKQFFYTAEEYATPIGLGLRSLQAKNFTCAGIRFWFPPQATVREESSSSGSGVPFGGGYLVYYKNQVNMNGSTFIPKSEIVSSNIPSVSSVGGLDITYKEFNNAALLDYGLDVNKTCRPNYQAIKKAMDNYCSQMSLLQNRASENFTFEIDGVPTDSFDVLDGLTSFEVRVSDNGIKTVLQFSDYRDNKISKSEAFEEYLYQLSFRPPYLTNPQFLQKTSLLNQNTVPVQ